MLVFDIMVFTLTLHKALQLQRAGGVSLLTLLLRDGSYLHPYQSNNHAEKCIRFGLFWVGFGPRVDVTS